MKRPAIRAKRVKALCFGGPWDGEYVLLPDSGTMFFSVGAFVGSYSATGMWKDAKK